MSLASKIRSGFNKVILAGSMTLLPLTGCYSSTTYNDDNQYRTEINRTDNESKSFVGTPVALLHHNDGDLEFELESYDEFEQKTYKINVYENADKSNIKNLSLIKDWITQSLNEGNTEFRIEGFYDKELESKGYEKGSMDPFAVIRLEKVFADSTWKDFEEVAWTDGKDSKIYKENNSEIVFHHVYTPGHVIWHTHYPIGFYPYWDRDGDGIPNNWDPWPNTFGPWVDRNHNGLWDWYDPYYPGVYWNYWGDYWGHSRSSIVIIWGDHYKNHRWDKYKDRHHDISRLRSNLGERRIKDRNIKDRDERKRHTRDPFVKDRKLVRNYEERTRDKVIKNRIPNNERNLEDRINRSKIREREINRTKPDVRKYNPNIEKPRYERKDNKETKYYRPNSEYKQKQYTKPKTQTRQYTPRSEAKQVPRQRTYSPPPKTQSSTPRNSTPPKTNSGQNTSKRTNRK